MFCKHGIDPVLTDAVRGDREAFHFHCAKCHASTILRATLDRLICGAGVWTTQGFEHRIKQSNCIYEKKTNGKGNCCKQVLKGLHHRFIRTS